MEVKWNRRRRFGESGRKAGLSLDVDSGGRGERGGSGIGRQDEGGGPWGEKNGEAWGLARGRREPGKAREAAQKGATRTSASNAR